LAPPYPSPRYISWNEAICGLFKLQAPNQHHIVLLSNMSATTTAPVVELTQLHVPHHGQSHSANSSIIVPLPVAVEATQSTNRVFQAAPTIVSQRSRFLIISLVVIGNLIQVSCVKSKVPAILLTALVRLQLRHSRGRPRVQQGPRTRSRSRQSQLDGCRIRVVYKPCTHSFDRGG
jgi:hypothetical protein